MALAAIPLASLHAQDTRIPGPFAPSGRPTAPCLGQTIEDIVVYSEAPSVANLQRVPVLAKIARAMHVTTKADVVERYMLLERGDKCSELRRAESERILRAQPFLADARIYVIPSDSSGRVDLEVRTSDEASIVIGGSERGRTPFLTSLLFGNANLGGEGVFVAGAWRYGDGFRDAWTGRIIDYQFMQQSMVATLEGERNDLGGSWRAQIMRPFYTNLQRFAWRAQAGQSDAYVELRRPDGDRPAVNLVRQYFDVGGVTRIGSPRLLTLVGFSITGNDERSSDQLIEGDSGYARVVGVLPHPYPAHRVARANLLFGVRRISFVRREGLDAITGQQDVPLGIQLGGSAGRSVRSLGARNDDTFLTGDLYAGATSGIGLFRLQAKGEARRGLGSTAWDGILTSARATHTLQFSPTHVNQFNLEWSGAYRMRTPFQLLFGVPEGGVRGYESSTLVGGQRLVGRAEERFVLGRFLSQSDVGIAFFSDVGKQWAGDVPFGVTTGPKASIGIGLIAAIPPKSTRVWRADLAIPITNGAARGWEISFTNVDRARFVFREPRDVADGREPTIPSSIFSWP
jgi:hypothetical protein